MRGEDDLAKALAAIEEFKEDELDIFKYEPKVEQVQKKIALPLTPI